MTFDDVRAAAARIAPFVHRTPVLTSQLLDEWAGRAAKPEPGRPLGRRERVRLCFGTGRGTSLRAPWDEEKVLDRYELFVYKQWLRVYMRSKMIKHNKDLFESIDDTPALLEKLHIY